jgi:hypothetical protein
MLRDHFVSAVLVAHDLIRKPATTFRDHARAKLGCDRIARMIFYSSLPGVGFPRRWRRGVPVTGQSIVSVGSLDFAAVFHSRQFSMDHRVKPGGEEGWGGGMKRVPRRRKELIVPKRDYPGRLTLDQWRALPREKRRDMAKRAQCDLLGSFRFCTNKKCRRARSCSGDPDACQEKLWRQVKKKPKTFREEYARIGALPNA